MICPACNEEMIVVEYQKIELDVCMFCRGIWFDGHELELLLSTLRVAPGHALDGAAAKTAEQPRKCPYCRARMDKVLVGPAADVLIDRCGKGHGLWFDGGELDAVVAELQKSAPGVRPDAHAAGKVGSFLADVLLANDKADKTNPEQKGGKR